MYGMSNDLTEMPGMSHDGDTQKRIVNERGEQIHFNAFQYEVYFIGLGNQKL